MPLTVEWTTYAKLSYFDELDYINLKWSNREVENFIDLVGEFVNRLSSGTVQGKVYPNNNMSSIVISTQTTVFFRKNPLNNSITLLLFWNNQKNIKTLERILQKL